MHRPSAEVSGGALTVGSPFFSLIMFSPAAWQGLVSKAFLLVSSWPRCARSPRICPLAAPRRSLQSDKRSGVSLRTSRGGGGWLVRSARPRRALANLPDVMRAGVSNAARFGEKMRRSYAIDKPQLSSSSEERDAAQIGSVLHKSHGTDKITFSGVL